VATGLTEIFVGWHTAITPKRSEQPPRLLLQCAQTGKPAGYPSLRIYTYTNVPLLRLSIKPRVRSVYPCTEGATLVVAQEAPIPLYSRGDPGGRPGSPESSLDTKTKYNSPFIPRGQYIPWPSQPRRASCRQGPPGPLCWPRSSLVPSQNASLKPACVWAQCPVSRPTQI